MNHELLGRLDELKNLTRDQLECARRLDGDRLAELNFRRQELMFDLQLLIDESLPVPIEHLQTVRDVCAEVNRLEERLEVVSRAVLDAIGGSAATNTYDQLGRVGKAG
ncbi:MAG: hypothetical protein ACJAZO_002026 [Myxococcota bacterium]